VEIQPLDARPWRTAEGRGRSKDGFFNKLLHWLSRHRHLLCSPPRVRGRFFGSNGGSSSPARCRHEPASSSIWLSLVFSLAMGAEAVTSGGDGGVGDAWRRRRSLSEASSLSSTSATSLLAVIHAEDFR
jgi:hypothetical protein